MEAVKQAYAVNQARTESDKELLDKLAPWRLADGSYCFRPTWRAQIFRLIGFLILCIATVAVSQLWSSLLVVRGPLFAIGSYRYFLHFPIVAVIPAVFLGKILIFLYDARYLIDRRGVEAQIGLVSLSLRQPRLRYEDIRGVEPKQTLVERILGIGTLMVGSAMTFEVEIIMDGIDDPRSVQRLINLRRDNYLREFRKDKKRAWVESSGD